MINNVLSPEAIDAYRKMGPSGRLNLTIQAIRENTPHLYVGTPEVVKRRLELIRNQHAEHSYLLRHRLMGIEIDYQES
jgi:hypothetical protein